MFKHNPTQTGSKQVQPDPNLDTSVGYYLEQAKKAPKANPAEKKEDVSVYTTAPGSCSI